MSIEKYCDYRQLRFTIPIFCDLLVAIIFVLNVSSSNLIYMIIFPYI